jgi:putative transposase
MPWGLTRFQQSGQSHFVTFCCYHRRRLFTTDVSCRIFEAAVERVRRNYGLYIYGYIVMPEHVHLLLSEPQRDTLADALKSLKQGVSARGGLTRFLHSELNGRRSAIGERFVPTR